jgi:hypothetical protein
MTPRLEAVMNERAEEHYWSCDCTCDDQDTGACFFHLSDREKAQQSFLAGFRAALAEVAPLVEALEHYANHESVIKEAYHTGEEKQIHVVHTFINHVARAALAKWNGGE